MRPRGLFGRLEAALVRFSVRDRQTLIPQDKICQ